MTDAPASASPPSSGAATPPPASPPRPPAPPSGAGSPPPPPPSAPPPPTPGFREQIGATRDAAKRLVDAHVELGKAELEEISGEIGRVAAFAGIAVAAGLFAGLLLAIGLPLFLGELVFGSIGWGLLLGVETLVGVTIAAALMAAGVESTRIGLTALTGFAAGLAVALVLGSGVSNLIWGVTGENLLPLAAPDVQPLAAAMVVLPVVLALLVGLLSLISALRNRDASEQSTRSSIGERIAVGAPVALYVGWLTAYALAYTQGIAWFDWQLVGAIVAGAIVAEVVAVVLGTWRSGFALLSGLSIGAGLGVILALLTAIAFGWRVGIAIGVAIGLGTWIGMLALEGTRIAELFTEENLKKRFYPERTVEMTKETIEWARARMPLSRKS